MIKFDFFQYEDVIELDIPVDIEALHNVDFNWVQYNPRKQVKRWGCSITSLDGGDSGIPDLDSIPEYNRTHRTQYTEKHFNTPTKHSTPFAHFLRTFEVGRSHYLKLDPGGFFPWHRDHDDETFRLIYTISNCGPNSFVWLEDDNLVKLDNQRWYYINTKKKHSVFSFDTSVFAVFNVMCNDTNFKTMRRHFRIL